MTTTLKRVIGLLLGTGSYAVLTVLLVGCGGGSATEAQPAPPATTATAPKTIACTAGVEPHGSDELAYGAAALRDLRIYDRPGGPPGRAVQEDQPERGADGLRRRRAAGRGELQAELVPGPAAPQAERSARLGARRRREGRRGPDADPRRPLRAARDALPVGQARAHHACGRRGDVDADADGDVLRRPAPVLGDPGGPFGPSAVGIAAYSEVLTGWTQGGPIAIHGTNRPDLIGQAVSNGCVRVRNEVVTRIFDATLSGTPVVIQE